MIKKITDFIYVAALTLFYLFSSIFVFIWCGIKCIFKDDK